MSQLKDRQSERERGREGKREREGIFSYSAFFVRAFSGLDETTPHWGGQSALLSLPVQMLILSKNTLTDTPRDNV